MTTTEQIRKLLNGYVIDRNTLQEIKVSARATRAAMESAARKYGLTIEVDGDEARLIDDCYTYAVRDGAVVVVAG